VVRKCIKHTMLTCVTSQNVFLMSKSPKIKFCGSFLISVRYKKSTKKLFLGTKM
jgi:hypothetical protein